MKEIEVKILEIDKDKVIRKLEELGAEKEFDGKIEGHHFDFEDRKLTKEKKMVRLRKQCDIVQGDTVFLTFKQKISKKIAKQSIEHEVEVKDFEAMKKILSGIGLGGYSQASKHRISYALDNVHFDIDTYKGIPTFLEIEATTVEKVEEHVKKLGFTMEQTKSWTGKDVLEHYGKQ